MNTMTVPACLPTTIMSVSDIEKFQKKNKNKENSLAIVNVVNVYFNL